MRKRRKLLVIILVIAVILASDALIIYLTAPTPSNQIVSIIERSSAFRKETANATYFYLGYDNGRTWTFKCGPNPIFGSITHLFWPPPSYNNVTFFFSVQANSTSPFPYINGILYVHANPSTGQIYGMSASGVCT